jgi:hypothetical protein
MKNLAAVAASAVTEKYGVGTQTITLLSDTASQERYAVVTKLGPPPGAGGQVFQVMVKKDGTAGVLYIPNQHAISFDVQADTIVFKS